MENIKPSLIEPGVKYFLKNTLKECNNFRESHYSFIYNISMAILFLECK